MKKTLLGTSLLLSCMYVQADVWDDVTFVPSLAFQNKNLSFDQRYSGAATNDAEFSANLPMISTSLTTVYKRFYLTVKLEKTLAETSTSTQETDRSSFSQSNLIALNGSNVDVGRKDQSITLAYNVIERVNIFLGFLKGETSLKPDAFCADPTSSSPCSRSNRAFQQFFIGDNNFFTTEYESATGDVFNSASQPVYEQKYTESGPFIGATYSWPIRDIGTFSFSVAYAQMDGQYEDNASDPTKVFGTPLYTADSSTLTAFDYEGDSTGASLGVTWVSAFNETAAYFVDLRHQQYSMTGSDANLPGVSLRTDEKMASISAGLQFYF